MDVPIKTSLMSFHPPPLSLPLLLLLLGILFSRNPLNQHFSPPTLPGALKWLIGNTAPDRFDACHGCWLTSPLSSEPALGFFFALGLSLYPGLLLCPDFSLALLLFLLLSRSCNLASSAVFLSICFSVFFTSFCLR